MTHSEDPLPPVTHNRDQTRFEVSDGGGLSILTYHRSGDRLALLHTEVPEALRGRGVASRLAEAALSYARTERLQVVPRCPFVAGFISRHPEYADLLANH